MATTFMKPIFIVLLLVSFTSAIYAQVIERTYLQTDKQLYIAGELIWLKVYTTGTEGKLQEFSKIGYVELLSDSESKVQVKLEIKDGTGAGCMELPATLETGNYRLSAYTRYMRNEGENVFFEKIVTIINPLQNENTAKSTDSDNALAGTAPQVKTVQLSVDKTILGKREKGIITIAGLPKEYTSLAISVAGEVPFSHEDKSITDWKNGLRQPIASSVEKSFLPEYEGAIISTQLIDNNGNIPSSFQGANTMLSFPGKRVQIYSGQSVGDGVYNFYTQEIGGKKELTTTVFPDNGNSYHLDLRPSFSAHSSKPLPSFHLDSIWKDYLSMRSLSLQVTRAYTADSMNQIRPTPPFNALTPFRKYALEEYTRFQNMEEIFIEFIPEARIRKINDKRSFSVVSDVNNNFSTDYVLVLLDNVPIADHDLMCNYNALLIEKIDLYQGRYIYGGQLYGGIIHFITYKGDYPGIKFEPYTQLLNFEGTQPYRYFYSPIYEETVNSTRMPDFRHTLLWEPFVDCKDGESITIPFYTSDIPGKYDVKLEGISKEGKIINATLQIEVVE